MFYHVLNRGNVRQKLFYNDRDFIRFFYYLEKYASELKMKFLSYILMPNHFHLLTENILENQALSKFMHKLCTAYSMYFNTKYKKSGHVFQGRFKSRVVTSQSDLVHLSRYIHQNCVELCPSKKWRDIVKFMRTYEWSSYRYLSKPVCIPSYLSTELLSLFNDSTKQFAQFSEIPIEKWEKALREVEPQKTATRQT